MIVAPTASSTTTSSGIQGDGGASLGTGVSNGAGSVDDMVVEYPFVKPQTSDLEPAS
jgi:hypothetical protein